MRENKMCITYTRRYFFMLSYFRFAYSFFLIANYKQRGQITFDVWITLFVFFSLSILWRSFAGFHSVDRNSRNDKCWRSSKVTNVQTIMIPSTNQSQNVNNSNYTNYVLTRVLSCFAIAIYFVCVCVFFVQYSCHIAAYYIPKAEA